MCAVFGGGGGEECIWGCPVHLEDISVLGVYREYICGEGQSALWGYLSDWGDIISALGVFHNNSDIPQCTTHMSLRVEIVTQFENNLFLIIF